MTVTLSPLQENALAAIEKWYNNKKSPQVFYLAGYAGTGKSTIASKAIENLGVDHVRTAAFTGKAASVLRRKGVPNAQTIHSLIYKPREDKDGKLTWVISSDSDARSADLIMLDECSMVDKEMADDLLSFRKKVLVMGDPGQLPPIQGQGAFAANEPDFFLDEIHRQAAESPILELATMAREGKRLPVLYERGDVRVLPLNRETANLIHRPDTQVICGTHVVRYKITQMIRRQLLGEEWKPKPTVGERVICCKNNRENGLFNGLMGTIQGITPTETPWAFEVMMEDRDNPTSTNIDPYLFARHFDPKREPATKKRIYDEFDWAYAITAHKAQGSQWDHVTVIDDSNVFREQKHRWLYTAISRASNGLTVLVRQ